MSYYYDPRIPNNFNLLSEGRRRQREEEVANNASEHQQTSAISALTPHSNNAFVVTNHNFLLNHQQKPEKSSGAVLAFVEAFFGNKHAINSLQKLRLQMAVEAGSSKDSSSSSAEAAQRILDDLRVQEMLEKRDEGNFVGRSGRGRKLLAAMGHVEGEALGEGGLKKPLQAGGVVGSRK